MMSDHIEESLSIEREDFDLDPFAQAGGLLGAQRLGNQLDDPHRPQREAGGRVSEESRELPDGWVWTTLGEIGNYHNGRGLQEERMA